MDGLKRVYLAGPLFTAAERRWNHQVDDALRELGWRTFLPQTEAPKITHHWTEEGHTRERAIYEADRYGVDDCRRVLACLDGADADSGTCWEMGYATAKGYPVYWYRTDLRRAADDPESGVNLMLSGSATRLLLPDPVWTATADEVAAAFEAAILANEGYSVLANEGGGS